MKRIILIVLSFVSVTLVSCSQPEQYIENCADYEAEKVLKEYIADHKATIKKLDKNRPWYMSEITKEDCKGDLKDHRTCVYYEYLHNNEELLHKVKSLQLSDKLKNLNIYERKFKHCSQSFKEDEITFKAKWK